MRRALTLAAALAALTAPPCAADELKPALTATTEFLSLDGQPVPSIAPHMPVQIRVSIANGLGGGTPAGLKLFGWLRRIDADDLPCGQSAEAFLRTGRLPNGTMFLNDPVIGVVTEDGAFAVSDPDFSLASANILGAVTLDSARRGAARRSKGAAVPAGSARYGAGADDRRRRP